MNRIFKTTVLAVAIAATSLSALSKAEARDGWRRHHHDRHDAGDLVAAGVAGLALGAIVGGLASSNDRHYVDEPDYVYREPVVRPRPYREIYIEPDYSDYADVYEEQGAEPWSTAWFTSCEERYRSFNARTGTFVGYDGAEHFCVAN